jgi:immunoglobulin-like protein involved in spore germination
VRTTRAALVTVSLAAVVLTGCAAGKPVNPVASAEGRAPAQTGSSDAAEANATTTSRTGTRMHARPSAAEAVATATAYMHREVGMTDPAAGPFRWTGADTGEVTVHPRSGEGGRSWPAGGAVSVVTLRRLSTVWYVTGVRTRNIQISEPHRLAWVTSPVQVTGRARVFEGSVQVKVTEDRYGKDVELGSGFVTGSGDERLGPFSGRIAFRRPSDTSGSIIFYEEAAATGGGVIQATVVRVRFAQPSKTAPRILEVTTTPALPFTDGWLQVPAGAGTVTVRVKAANTQRVRFTLTPTGTGTAPYARVIGEDATASDGFTLTWRYKKDENLMGHLDIRATGPGGKTGRTINLYHEGSAR